MQKRKHFPGRHVWLWPLLILSAAGFLWISSCTSGTTKATITGPSCVTLTSKQINDMWVTPGYTKPGNTNQVTWLKIYTGYSGPGTNFSANVNGMKSDNSQAPDSKIDMAAGTGCTVTLPADLAIGSNTIDLAALDILEKDGTLKKTLDYVKFTPQPFPANKTFLNYTVEVVYTTGAVAKGETLPCPPCIYCRPPCDTI